MNIENFELKDINEYKLINHPKFLDKTMYSEYLENITKEQKEQKTRVSIVTEKTINETYSFIEFGLDHCYDYVAVMNNGKLEAVFNVYDLESCYYDEDLDSIIASGHETLHHYILHNKKYKRAYTR